MTKSDIFAAKLIGEEQFRNTGKGIYNNIMKRMSQLSGSTIGHLLAFCKASGCNCTNNIVCPKYQIFKQLITE